MSLRMTAAVLLAASVIISSGCMGRPKEGGLKPPPPTTNFKELFASNCSGCHGTNGMKGPAPRLNDPLYLAFTNRDEIYNILQYGRKPTSMPAFGPKGGGALKEEQINALADGIMNEWARPVDFKGAAKPTYEIAKAPPGDVSKGQLTYMKNCMACHGFGKFKGAAGAVVDPSVLALISDQGLRTTMIVGRPDWGMPDWRHRVPGHPMTDQEMSDVGAWLASQRPHYSQEDSEGIASPGNPPSINTSQGQSNTSQQEKQ